MKIIALLSMIMMAVMVTMTGPAFAGSGPHSVCSDCHLRGNALKAPTVNVLCRTCHTTHSTFDHQGVSPQQPAPGLPLDKEGKVYCTTCHEPHGKGTVGKQLRMEESALCVACHPPK